MDDKKAAVITSTPERIVRHWVNEDGWHTIEVITSRGLGDQEFVRKCVRLSDDEFRTLSAQEPK